MGTFLWASATSAVSAEVHSPTIDFSRIALFRSAAIGPRYWCPLVDGNACGPLKRTFAATTPPCGRCWLNMWHWRTYIISWPCVFRMHSTRMQSKCDNHWTAHQDVWGTYFCWSNRKITGVAGTSRTSACVVQRHGRTCSKCVERYCDLANKKVEQLWKVSHPCLDGHQFKQEELESVGKLSEVCSQIVFKCLSLARIRRVCEQACKISHKMDSSMWQTISKADFLFSSHRTISGNIVMWETRRSIADWVSSKTQILLAILRTQSQLQVVSCVFLEVEHLSQSVGCVRNRLQFHTVPQSLRSFLTMLTGLRMDGLLALDLWDLVIEVLRTTKDKPQPSHVSHQEAGAVQSTHSSHQETWAVLESKNMTHHVTRKQKVDQSSQVDHVPKNTRFSQGESQLYIFEVNEAVIKMIIKGRSSTMRHVYRTLRVALDWFVWQNWSGTQNRNQLCWHQERPPWHSAEREWNHFLCLFNIVTFHIYSHSHLQNFLPQTRKRLAIGIVSKKKTRCSLERFTIGESQTH